MAKIEKFPSNIFVTIDEDGDENYLSIPKPDATKAEDAITERKKTKVAHYQLVKVVEGQLEPVISAEIG